MPIAILTDGDLVPVGQPITPIKWDLEDKFKSVGACSLTTQASSELLTSLKTPNVRVVFIRDNGGIFSGPAECLGYVESSVKDGLGLCDIRWATNLAYLSERVTYPDPARASTDQNTVESWQAMSTNAELVIRSLVNANAGPGARSERVTSKLALGNIANVGTDVTCSTRFEVLLDVIRNMALSGGGLGFEITETPSRQLKFSVYQPRDLSKRVRFSQAWNNLRSASVKPDAPTATAAIVAGQGEGIARTIIECADATSGWRRIEKFVDQRNTDDATELQQAGQNALKEGAAKLVAEAETIETEQQLYGAELRLGDCVSVEYAPGVQVSEIVRAIRITGSAKDGEVVKLIVGSEGAESDDDVLVAWRESDARIINLERR
jgi:hypothetical protein